MASTNTDLIIPREFDYSTISDDVAKESNYVSFSPVSGTSWGPSQNIDFRISSNDQFINFQNSFLRYTLSITDTSTASHSTLGGISVLQTITEKVGGLMISNENDYNNRMAITYSKLPAHHKNKLKTLEGYSSNALFSYTGLSSSNGRTVYHQLSTPLWESNQLFPLAFVNNLELSITTAPLNSVRILAAASTYVITNCELVLHMVRPTDGYLSAVQASLNGGRQMSIPLNIKRSYRSSLAATTQQVINLSLPVCDSITGVLITQRENSVMDSATNDEFANYTNNALKEYYFESSGKRYPQNFPVRSCNTVSNGPIEVQNIAFGSLFDVNNSFTMNADIVSGSTATNVEQCILYNFVSNSHFGNGIKSNDGRLGVNLSYYTAPDGTENIVIYIAMDAILSITKDAPYLRFTALKN